MKKKIFIVLYIITTLFIFRNSTDTAVISSGKSGIIVDLVMKFLRTKDYDLVTLIIRKTAHFVEFFMQSFFLSCVLAKNYKKHIIYVLFFGLLTACTDEFIQLFSNGRAGMVEDVVLDFSAVCLCTLLFFIGTVIYNRKMRK